MGEWNGSGFSWHAVCDARLQCAQSECGRGKRLRAPDSRVRIDRAGFVDGMDSERFRCRVEGRQETAADRILPNWVCNILVRVYAARLIYVIRIECLSELSDQLIFVADYRDTVPLAQPAC